MMHVEHPERESLRARDGRNIDPEVAELLGEGAQQRVRELPRPPVHPSPAARAEEPERPTYYGLPVLKEPVWGWEIPAYFFTGGLAGACGVLGAAAQAVGGEGVEPLVRRCRRVAMGAAAVSAVFLIRDLGRPARFLAMMRVFRPTSPMNMGTWVLSGFGACAGLATLPDLLPVPRWVARAADLAAYGAAAFGLPLVGYTGVLLANTAVPIWQQTRNTLPVLFAFSGAVSAGALFDLWPTGERCDDLAWRFGTVAKGAELAMSVTMHREARVVPSVERPLKHGRSGLLLRAARALLLGSVIADLTGRSSPTRRRIAGAMAMAGTLALRFGIVAAGRASARDPHATFDMQRAGRGAAELVRKEGRTAQMPSLPGVDATGRESVQHAPGP